MSTGPTHSVGQEGLGNIAHAIRRATALHVAMSISPEDSSVDDLLDTADRLAQWILGTAHGAGNKPAAPPDQFMGSNPWAEGGSG